MFITHHLAVRLVARQSAERVNDPGFMPANDRAATGVVGGMIALTTILFCKRTATRIGAGIELGGEQGSSVVSQAALACSECGVMHPSKQGQAQSESLRESKGRIGPSHSPVLTLELVQWVGQVPRGTPNSG